jgi:nucleoside-diphosphate-sugar epimerase
MKIVVTGGSGFIGKWLALHLNKEGHEVLLTGREEQGSTLHIANMSFTYARTDHDALSLTKLFKTSDAVVHLAAPRFVDNERFDLYQENLRLAWNVFEAARFAGIHNIVWLSSRAVYDFQQPLPWKEDRPTVPLNLYGASKLAIESLASLLTQQHEMGIKSLRVAQVLGIGEKDDNVMSVFTSQAAQGTPLSLHGTGAVRRDYVYVKDVCGAILSALGKAETSGIFNIGSGKSLTLKQLAEAMIKGFESKGGLRFVPVASEPQEDWSLDISKAKSLLGWSPSWTLETAISDMRRNLLEGNYV